MKAAFRDIPLKPIYAAYAEETPLKSIWAGDKKIWPDNSRRVTRIWLDVAGLTEQQRAYWNIALQNITAGANATRFIRLTASRTYNIDSTYDTYALATHEGNGCIAFPAGTGPLADEVVAGKKATIRMVMPKSNSSHILGTSSISIPISDTRVHLHYTKWQKRVSTGCRCIIKGMPSETVVMNEYRQRNGHCRTTCDNDVGTFPALPAGDTYATITASLHQTSLYGVYLAYPAFDITITPTILRTETTTIES